MFQGLSIFLFLLTWLQVVQLGASFQQVCEKNRKASFFTTDHLNNWYVVDKNMLIKYNSRCNQEASYSKAPAYTFDQVDVTDPLKILVFSKDFNQLFFLNNQLAEISDPVALDNYGYYAVGAVCTSASGGFWIFDQSTLQLVYFNHELKEQRKSAHLGSFFGQGADASTLLLREKNDYLYLGIPQEGILQFDLYGSYIRTLPVKFESDFQVVNQKLIFYRPGRLFFYDMQTFEEQSLDLPVEQAVNARLENQRIYIQQKNKLVIYQWQNENK
ncbi:MAG: hypothetical protein V2I54_12890 [Bacteroidales bacterium]|nr:hypothetical protein [Bacteroidales bacterium]